MSSEPEIPSSSRWWSFKGLFTKSTATQDENHGSVGPSKWTMGMLNDRETVEAPGSVLLLASDRNEPLGLTNIQARTSHSSIPTGFRVEIPTGKKKKTEDGAIILDPQPDDSENDPLNWPSWRRDAALFSLGFYCMIGGGITPLIAAGFTNVAHDFDVSIDTVALTTGFCMMGLGVGAVLASPTAILYGKRPVYLFGAVMFIGTALWAGFSPSFPSLLASRVFMGISISPVECLPSATIAEIFFLHERAFRVGIYTLLLLSGKNLVPLVGAVIIGKLGWRWAFFIAALVVSFAVILLFLFVPETFWDRTPTRSQPRKPSLFRRLSSKNRETPQIVPPKRTSESSASLESENHVSSSKAAKREHRDGTVSSQHVNFEDPGSTETSNIRESKNIQVGFNESPSMSLSPGQTDTHAVDNKNASGKSSPKSHSCNIQHPSSAFFSGNTVDETFNPLSVDPEKNSPLADTKANLYTHTLKQEPALSFTQQLKPYNGRLNPDNWFKVLFRPFILFAYPAVLWSAITYSCAIGWLIVMSETMAMIYRDPNGYNFNALQTGLIYISPFIGGVLGTGVAGKISDILVRAMAARNGGLYEPEFRLIMAGPILLSTCIGLMGFGWSVEEKDAWIVPTVFFGVISFGCSLASTTAITFCVDSYRQYAGEALVTLNFTKNIMHGLVFSLFVTHWIQKDGPKDVYIWIGVIQLIVCLLAIPVYIFGKRARIWTARKNLMEKF